ncbi:CDP-glucose 4,6-dehydratase [Synechococcus elongatus]|uniref:CDP-glucose 4,6-dehydratase n=1 Tax=Synechococcus elongatus PCC 11801 TaxID=2219813 RepID=A0AAN1QQE2_SYNEL|nr:CDP-glucose 4,6-dehydratase [Synechococcus elongatus]AZB73593.1 CDP-glucose 4,6-dehydratase [Synechococcus elongatus PCC 11801]
MMLTFWQDRRVLVTGHTGFKGSWLTLWLLTLGAEVWGYALPPDADASLFIELQLEATPKQSGWGELHHCTGDINDASRLQACIAEAQPEVVLHLAAQPLVRQSYVDPLGTWQTNVLGSLQLLEVVKELQHPCAVVMVTTDKVYDNREWIYGYRESDRLGGHDPYSASKAAMELAVASWRSSFCGSAAHQNPYLAIATARAGNVIGGGDWAADRLVPDAMRALLEGQVIPVRNPQATRPWQHVLEPLGGYLLLAQRLYEQQQQTLGEPNHYAQAFNFGPALESNRSVQELIQAILVHWPGEWVDRSEATAPHEAGLLHLVSDKAQRLLSWRSRWDFETTVKRTVSWYRQVALGRSSLDCCLEDLAAYVMAMTGHVA